MQWLKLKHLKSALTNGPMWPVKEFTLRRSLSLDVHGIKPAKAQSTHTCHHNS